VTRCANQPDCSDAEVVRLVTAWIQNTKLPKNDVYKAFANAEFKKRLRSYRFRGRVWRGAQILTWLAIALLGLLGSVLAAASTGDTGRIFAIVAGALVGILSTFSQAAHPGRQADAHETARLAIRDEAWALLNGIEPYEKTGKEPLTPEEAFKKFITQIRTIVKRKRAATRISDFS
jgi:hypothetical protein